MSLNQYVKYLLTDRHAQGKRAALYRRSTILPAAATKATIAANCAAGDFLRPLPRMSHFDVEFANRPESQ
jgi:hypothetical protein